MTHFNRYPHVWISPNNDTHVQLFHILHILHIMKHSLRNETLSAKCSEYNIYLVGFERRLGMYSSQSPKRIWMQHCAMGMMRLAWRQSLLLFGKTRDYINNYRWVSHAVSDRYSKTRIFFFFFRFCNQTTSLEKKKKMHERSKKSCGSITTPQGWLNWIFIYSCHMFDWL